MVVLNGIIWLLAHIFNHYVKHLSKIMERTCISLQYIRDYLWSVLLCNNFLEICSEIAFESGPADTLAHTWMLRGMFTFENINVSLPTNASFVLCCYYCQNLY